MRGSMAILLALITTTMATASVDLPSGGRIESVDFERHVMGVFGRAGCAGGGCHGSFQGKGTFRLSLFGFEPDKDFFALTRDGFARRVNPVDPENSLVLLKATGQVSHAGGVRFAKGSWQYQILLDWIRAGAPWTPGSGDIRQIRVSPPDLNFTRAGETVPLQVLARFGDDSETDITALCDFRTNDDAIADVSNLGVAQSHKAGSTALVVSYRGSVVPVRVIVPIDTPPGFVYPDVPRSNFVDREVFDRLKRLKMVPSDLSSDDEFLRRVTIDTIGRLPSPEDYRSFRADTSADKRARKIDELLAHPLHAALWATKFSDITGNDTPALEQPAPLKAKRSQAWHDWLKKRVFENRPYDELVRGILVATSREGKNTEDWIKHVEAIDQQMDASHDSDYADRETLDLFWRRNQLVPIEQWAEKTAAAFMGVRIECAQCHKHPFDRWSQVEYRAYANIFSQVAAGVAPESKKTIDAINADRKAKAGKGNNTNLIKEVYLAATPKRLPHPDTGAALAPKTLGGPELVYEKGKDLRADLHAWLIQPDNPFFARSFVNRVWGHYFGIGIVHPVDDFSLGNPASNQQLLDALAQEFIDKKFDIRHIERVILNSRTYQLSSRPNDTNRLDKVNYARSYIRPMMAEAVVDVLNSALATSEKFGPEIRPGLKAVEVGASQLTNRNWSYAFRVFGRPSRTSACDCDRAMDPALPQKLFLMTDPVLLQKFNDPNGRVLTLAKSSMSDDEVLDELFLATLGRAPTASDRQAFVEHCKTADRRTALIDTMWALINTREFILNH